MATRQLIDNAPCSAAAAAAAAAAVAAAATAATALSMVELKMIPELPRCGALHAIRYEHEGEYKYGSFRDDTSSTTPRRRERPVLRGHQRSPCMRDLTPLVRVTDTSLKHVWFHRCGVVYTK